MFENCSSKWVSGMSKITITVTVPSDATDDVIMDTVRHEINHGADKMQRAQKGIAFMKRRLECTDSVVDDDLDFLLTDHGYQQVKQFFLKLSPGSIKRYCLFIIWILKYGRDRFHVDSDGDSDHFFETWRKKYTVEMNAASRKIHLHQRYSRNRVPTGIRKQVRDVVCRHLENTEHDPKQRKAESTLNDYCGKIVRLFERTLASTTLKDLKRSEFIITRVSDMFREGTIDIQTYRGTYSAVQFFVDNCPSDIVSDEIRPLLRKQYEAWYKTMPSSYERCQHRDACWTGYYGYNWPRLSGKIDELRAIGALNEDDRLLLFLYFDLPVRRTKDYTFMIINPSGTFADSSNVLIFNPNPDDDDRQACGEMIFRQWKTVKKNGYQHQKIYPSSQVRLVEAIKAKIQMFPEDAYLLMRGDKDNRKPMDHNDVSKELSRLERTHHIPVQLNKLRHLYASHVHFVDGTRYGYESQADWESTIAEMMGTSVEMLRKHYIDGYVETRRKRG